MAKYDDGLMTLGSTVGLAPALPMPPLVYDEEVARATASVYDKVRDFIPAIEWPVHAPYVKAINDLKKVRNAVILAHNYQTPEIYHGVADFVGDSLALAREAARTSATVIVQAGVHFMAETSKILSPDKMVLIPDRRAGCSLAELITAEDVRLLRQRYPGVPVVTYVNTSAAVKAESDVTCTSSNAVKVVESLGTDTVIMIPDEFLALNVAKQTKVRIITWKGHCEVHERFSAAELLSFRDAHPGLQIIAHPECPPEVIAIADFTGSTTGMIDHVTRTRPAKALLVTECSMAANIQAQVPGTQFVGPCNLCPHMQRITLPKILNSLLTLTEEVRVDPVLAARARTAVERMVNLRD